MTKRIVVQGGTSLGHAIAAVLAADPAHSVTVLTRQPHRWSSVVRAIYLDKAEVSGQVHVTSDPAAALEGAEVLFVCLPLTARAQGLAAIAPHLPNDCWVGGVPGFAGFDREALKALGPSAKVFGLQRVPYVRKTISYGETVWISGIRPKLFVATLPGGEAADLATQIEALLNIPTSPLSGYLAVNLSASNAIFHPARLLGAFGDVPPDHPFSHRPQFYEDWDDASSQAYLGLDDDLQRIARALGVDSHEAVSIREHFGVDDPSALTHRIRGIRALRDRPLPLRGSEGAFRIDPLSPYVTEDACFALPVLRSLADLAETPTPWMDLALRWSERLTGQEFLRGGRLAGAAAQGFPLAGPEIPRTLANRPVASDALLSIFSE